MPIIYQAVPVNVLQMSLKHFLKLGFGEFKAVVGLPTGMLKKFLKKGSLAVS